MDWTRVSIAGSLLKLYFTPLTWKMDCGASRRSSEAADYSVWERMGPDNTLLI